VAYPCSGVIVMQLAKSVLKGVLCAGAALFALNSANASTVTIASESYYNGVNNAPVLGTPLANDFSPTYDASVSGSIGDVERSPYETNTNGTAGAFYSVLDPGGGPPTSDAIYNLNGATSFVILWGSPDTYNQITFWSGADGTGTQLSTSGASGVNYVGTDTACYQTSCMQLAWDLITFNIAGGAGSVELSDTGTAAFEYGIPTDLTSLPTPIPAAMPLFAGGLGVLGLLGRRRKKKIQAHAAA
jgi:hypothetical protein